MGQALCNKFNGNTKEVLEYTHNFGIWEAMQEYDVKDYGAMCKFLIQASGDPGFIDKCIARSAEGKDIYSRIVDELIRRIFDATVRNEEMAQRVKVLEEKVRLTDRENRRKAIALLSVMQKV